MIRIIAFIGRPCMLIRIKGPEMEHIQNERRPERDGAFVFESLKRV